MNRSFHFIQLYPNDKKLFNRLSDGVIFESVTKGRDGAILLRPQRDGLIPLIRSTTKYLKPSQFFNYQHFKLAEKVSNEISRQSELCLNNILIEQYSTEYRKMGYHSDQSLDLKNDSFICLFSCYNDPNTTEKRVLRVKCKQTNEEEDFILENNSLIYFSTETNSKFLHKIILLKNNTNLKTPTESIWMGLTLRTSKTLISIDQLRLATYDEENMFMQMKRKENNTKNSNDFLNRVFNYTVSPGDILQPKTNDDKTFINQRKGDSKINFHHYLVLNDVDKLRSLENFVGQVIICKDWKIVESLSKTKKTGSFIFLAGDLADFDSTLNKESYFVIKEISQNYEMKGFQTISFHDVPKNVCGLGLMFSAFFDDGKNYFDILSSEHEFQQLTESNKPSFAFRTGIYLTHVISGEKQTTFKLLRCSSNFTGPTENFKSVDNEIVDKVNNVTNTFFKDASNLNHVLAQIYHNSQKNKAKIKRHSDKTKDMPSNGLIAFCTFYKNQWHSKVKRSKIDEFDYCYKGKSVLTTLKFRLKATQKEKYSHLPLEFSVKLYPNSVFIIPLITNRIYTHEICPSFLPFEYLPTRMGYVIRCSKTDSVHQNNQTFIKKSDGSFFPLEEPNDNDISQLTQLYIKENQSDSLVEYGDIFFSLNKGDYMKPIA